MKKMCSLPCSNGLNCKISIPFHIAGTTSTKRGVASHASAGFALLDVLLAASLFVVGMLGFLLFHHQLYSQWQHAVAIQNEYDEYALSQINPALMFSPLQKTDVERLAPFIPAAQNSN